jgi:hypothetical protein
VLLGLHSDLACDYILFLLNSDDFLLCLGNEFMFELLGLGLIFIELSFLRLGVDDILNGTADCFNLLLLLLLLLVQKLVLVALLFLHDFLLLLHGRLLTRSLDIAVALSALVGQLALACFDLVLQCG